MREYRTAYELKYTLTPTECAVLDAVERCRTAALGGHMDRCRDCGLELEPSYNSCHNRHCPKCPAVAQAKWIAGRLERVLPTHYFHAVFTLPAELRGVASANPSLVYQLLLRSCAATLLELGQDPKRLGGQLGVTAVLHTWTQKLELHPHAHCIVTGGGLVDDGTRWIEANPEYLFPVQVMGRLFRGKMLDALRRAEQRGQLRVADPARFAATVAGLYRKDWVVYCKRPFGGPQQVIAYLGQYTHRVAISNHRLVSIDQRGVTFRTKTGDAVTLDGVAFLSRWLNHVLPPGFTKIRHFGLLSARHATTRLETARRLLETNSPDAGAPASTSDNSDPACSPENLHTATWQDVIRILTGIDLGACPRCGSHALERKPLSAGAAHARAPPEAA